MSTLFMDTTVPAGFYTQPEISTTMSFRFGIIYPMDIRALASVLKGTATYIPGVYNLTKQAKGTGGTDSARYCYSVWLRHLVMARKNGLTVLPETVAEIGPGDSLGTGLAALLSGVEKYYALDIIKYANNKKNVEILDELTRLFKKREKIPDDSEFPLIKPSLESYKFPSHILSDEHLEKAMEQRRVKSIKDDLLNMGKDTVENSHMAYFAPWHNSKIIKKESIDMLYSQAVLEHIGDLSYSYTAMHDWLKPRGFISHEIDFTSHGKTQKWNGHWAYSNFIWSLIKGKKPYLLNREPHSTHIALLEKIGFELICDIKTEDTSGITRKELAPEFRNISDDDLIICNVFIQGIKK